MADFYGYREGPQVLVHMLVDSSSDPILKHDAVSFATAGYIKRAAAGDNVVGWADEAMDAAPSSNGGKGILVDVSTLSIYEFPPDAGSVTQTLVGLSCDLGGPRSIDIDASADDCIRIRRVDTDTNTLFVQRIETLAGVV